MTLPKYERGNTIKTDIDFKSDDVLEDPYDDIAYVDVIRPDGTYLMTDVSGTRDGEGEYHYYISTNSTDILGIYKIVWKAQHDVGGAQGLMPLRQRDTFQLVDVD